MGANFHHCVIDHSIFIKKINGSNVILAVYVNDMLLIGSDAFNITKTKEYLRSYFATKDMGKPRYFLGIEFAYANGRMTLSQRKCPRSSTRNRPFRV